MNVHPRIRIGALFLAAAFSFCSTIALNVPRPSTSVPQMDDQFDRKLMSVSSLDEAVDYVRLSAQGGSEKQLLQAADQFTRQRFYRGYSAFAPADNWLAYIAGYAWDDLRSPVIPDDILKHPKASCSQQAIVFQAIARKLGFAVGSIAFSNPGHFASAAKANGSWFYFDPNLEIVATNVPLTAVTTGFGLPALYGALGRNWKYAAEKGEISLRDLDSNPAPQATFFHQFTSLFSDYGWLIFSVLFVVATASRGSVRPGAVERLGAKLTSARSPPKANVSESWSSSDNARGHQTSGKLAAFGSFPQGGTTEHLFTSTAESEVGLCKCFIANGGITEVRLMNDWTLNRVWRRLTRPRAWSIWVRRLFMVGLPLTSVLWGSALAIAALVFILREAVKPLVSFWKDPAVRSRGHYYRRNQPEPFANIIDIIALKERHRSADTSLAA